MRLREILKGRGGLAVEFVLVVIGVLVALTVETALEDRRDAKLRDEYIERIRNDVATDRQGLEHRIEFFRDVQGFTQEFLDWLDTDTPVDKEIVLAAFYAAEVWPFAANTSTYQDLQNTGNIRLIDDIDLRTSLAAYHYRANISRSGWTPTEDYRQIIRGIIPNNVQGSIRQNCPTLEGLHGVPTGFPSCEIAGVDYQELTTLFAPLRADQELHRRLTYRHSELGVMIYLLADQQVFADAILEHIPGE